MKILLVCHRRSLLLLFLLLLLLLFDDDGCTLIKLITSNSNLLAKIPECEIVVQWHKKREECNHYN